MKAKRSKSRFFVGIFLRAVDKRVTVTEVLSGTAAATEIKSGDQILSINGKSVTSTMELSETLRRTNELEIRRARRTMRIRLRAVNVSNKRELAELLLGKGDRVPGIGWIYLDRHCDSKCDCVDNGVGCEIWYSYEGEGKNRGVLLKKHCRSRERNWKDFKYEWVEKECPAGPKEYF